MKRTYQPKKLKGKRKFGFLNRNSTKSGKSIIRKRMKNKRWRLTQ